MINLLKDYINQKCRMYGLKSNSIVANSRALIYEVEISNKIKVSFDEIKNTNTWNFKIDKLFKPIESCKYFRLIIEDKEKSIFLLEKSIETLKSELALKDDRIKKLDKYRVFYHMQKELRK